MDVAVLRECAAARQGVAMMDATTLGKIEIAGPDAPVFLNRVYTNGFAKLKVGKARYGVMCKADGMVFDDGITVRLAEDRYLMSTTTGNAAVVLDWLEEWLQTEWPHLAVRCTSVSEQWAAIAVVGPDSRAVVARMAPSLDVSAEGFGFMEFRDAMLDNGVPARISRISFSGELAYEINAEPWYGLAVWEAVFAAGQDYGITPCGTETMHVRRAEKGFVLVGQDAEGTVTPLDLGMDWVVSRPEDCIGKRSFSRADTAREDRKQLVGLLPVDPEERLPEGAQIVSPTAARQPPVPMLGHVTSSYRSAALGRTFALALVGGGRERIGQVLHVPVGDRDVAVEVTGSVFYDEGGARRDGRQPARTTTHPGGGPRAAAQPAGRSGRRELAAAGGRSARLVEEPFLTQVNLRVRPGSPAVARVEHALGLPVPHRVPNQVSGDEQDVVLWLGPDEWLVVAAQDRAAEVLTALRGALGDALGSSVDVSANRTTLRLAGPEVREVLEKVCSLDLHPRVFGPGQRAQTPVGRTQVVLWQVGAEPAYRLLVRCSFANYLADLLLDAMLEFNDR